MDVARAFTFITEDERWLEKLGLGALVSLLSTFIIPIPLLSGYMVGITRNVRDGLEKPLPEWNDLGKLFSDGLAVLVAQIVYTLPFWLLVCIGFFATVGFSGLAEMSEDAAVAGIMATFGLVFCLMLIFFVALLFISPAIVIQYVRTNDLSACFRFSEIIAIVRENSNDILIAVVASFGAGLIASAVIGVLSAIPCLGWVAAPILSFAVAPWLLTINGHLYGQIAARIEGGKAASL